MRYENWVAVRFKLCLDERCVARVGPGLSCVSVSQTRSRLRFCKLAGFRLGCVLVSLFGFRFHNLVMLDSVYVPLSWTGLG